jgi:hypothetical protein
MSKPIARVAIVSVIALALIAAVYMTVQGALAKAESAGAQAHVVNGLKTNLNHDRSTVSELEAFQSQSSDTFSEPGAGRHQGGGCESENHAVPLD